MLSFVFHRQPKAYQGSNTYKSKLDKETYRAVLEQALVEFNPSFEKRSGSLYGVVYYFYRKELGIDADNISKPIWDCLRGFAYDDDSQVVFRVAAKFGVEEANSIVPDNFQNLPENVYDAFIKFFEEANTPHFVYVELGQPIDWQIKFDWENEVIDGGTF